MDDANMEALREILQDMAQTIELISSGARSGNDLIFFLEEMLQTIEAWATKYNVAVDGIDHPDGGEAVDTDFVMRKSEDNQSKQEIVLESPVQEPLPSPGKFTTPDQVGKNQGASGRGGRRRTLRKKAVAKTSKSHAKSPKAGSSKTAKGKKKGSKGKTKNSKTKAKTKGSKAKTMTTKLGAKTPKTKALKGRPKGSKSVDKNAAGSAGSGVGADADAGGGAYRSLALCIREDKAGIDMITPQPASSLSKLRKVEVIESPDWLPYGWITEMKTRGTGSSAGSTDKYFLDPVSQRRFRSRREVVAFLEGSSRHDSPKGSSKSKPAKVLALRSHKLLAEQANEKSQGKGTSDNQDDSSMEVGSSQLVVASSASSRAIVPHQPSQPSEWLVYENMANLPYPMHEQMRAMENNTNKGDPDNATLAPWPWRFGNAEGLKRPFVDYKPDDNKGITSGGETEGSEPLTKRPKKTARKTVRIIGSHPNAGEDHGLQLSLCD